MKRMKIGIIGCGMISDIYLKNLTGRYSDRAEVVMCADMAADRAAETAAKYGIKAVTPEELLASPEVELVINLTIPAAHYEIAKKSLLAGKHAYSEKPLAMTVEEGEELLALAAEKGLYVGSAPDTFLGGGMQTVIRLINEGAIGKPVTVAANMLARGPESFHPRPETFYKPGAGPMMDMGPYYVAALAALFGPFRSVCGLAGTVLPNRVCTSEARRGDSFVTEVPTNYAAVVSFENGMTGTLRVSWDLPYTYWCSNIPVLEIRGTEGTLQCPDPNTFGGNYGFPFGEAGKTIRLIRPDGTLEELPIDPALEIENSRGLGVWEAIGALNAGAMPRISPAFALHVLEVLLAVEKSSNGHCFADIAHTCEKPAPRY